jgi:hypothetical protein
MSYVKGYRARELNAKMKRAENSSDDMQRIRTIRTAAYAKRDLEEQHARAQDEVRRIREEMETEQNQPSHEEQLDDALKAAVALSNQLKGLGAEPTTDEPEAGKKKKETVAA